MFDSSRLHNAPTRRRATAARRRRIAAQVESLEGRSLLAYSLTPLGQVALPEILDVTQGIVAINSAAEVAATGLSGNSSEAYFLNNNGQTTLLAPLQGDSSTTATAINETGEVVGYSSTSDGLGGMGGSTNDEAVLYSSKGQATDLGNLGGTSQATGIDDSRQVVGYSATGSSFNSPTHAFLYNRGGPLIDLGTLGGSQSVATAINDATEIVGYSTTAASGSPTHAFLLKGTGPLTASDDLGVPQGYTSSYATAISSNGEFIAGYATKTFTASDGLTETATEPFVYSNGKWTDLGNLGGTDAVANGVDASGDVVGYAVIPRTGVIGGTVTVAFVYTSSEGSRTSTRCSIPARIGRSRMPHPSTTMA